MRLALYPNASPAYVTGYLAFILNEVNPYLSEKESNDDLQWELGKKQAEQDYSKNATIVCGAETTPKVSVQFLSASGNWLDAGTSHSTGDLGATLDEVIEGAKQRAQQVKMMVPVGIKVRVVQHLVQVIEGE